jgi:hypothetical protein
MAAWHAGSSSSSRRRGSTEPARRQARNRQICPSVLRGDAPRGRGMEGQTLPRSVCRHGPTWNQLGNQLGSVVPWITHLGIVLIQPTRVGSIDPTSPSLFLERRALQEIDLGCARNLSYERALARWRSPIETTTRTKTSTSTAHLTSHRNAPAPTLERGHPSHSIMPRPRALLPLLLALTLGLAAPALAAQTNCPADPYVSWATPLFLPGLCYGD